MQHQTYDYCFIITTFNREGSLNELLTRILKQRKGRKFQITIFDDGSVNDFVSYDENIKYIKFYNNQGKKKFWYIIDQTFKYLKKINSKYYIYIQDDLVIDENFVDDVTKLYENLNDDKKISLEFRTDTRSTRPNWNNFNPKLRGDYIQTQWVELDFISERKFFEVLDFKINEVPLKRWVKNPNLSSGVGQQLTERLNKLKYHMYHTKNSLVKHGYEKSKMNLNERSVNDLKIM
jgi:hypothetical protein